MIAIFRVEYPNGRGPYTEGPPKTASGWSSAFQDILRMEHHQAHPNCPSPEADGISRSAHADMIFGFQSLATMCEWFDGAERLYLHTWGLVCSKYVARGPIISGKRQLAFYRKSAELLWQKPLNHF